VQRLVGLMKDARFSGDEEKVMELKNQIQPLREEIKSIRQKERFEREKEEDPEIQNLRLKTMEAKIAFREAKQRGESKEMIETLRKAKIEMWKEWKQRKMELNSTKNSM